MLNLSDRIAQITTTDDVLQTISSRSKIGAFNQAHTVWLSPSPPTPPPPTRFEQVCVAFCVSFFGRTHAGGPWLLATELTAAQGVPAVAESDDCARG